MGDGVSQWRPPAAPSQPALRGGARRNSAVYDPGGDDSPWRLEAAGSDPRQLHRDLRFCAYHRRILPGAGPAARIFVGRADHGYAAVAADDHCRSNHYCGGMAAQAAEISTEPISKAGRDRMFGELLGLWAASVWKGFGSPSVLRLIELGPRRGTMIAHALRTLRVLPPNC